MTGLRVASVTDAGHKILSLESSSYSAVNSLGFSPAWSNFVKSFRLVTNELLCSFLDDNSFLTWDNHLDWMREMTVHYSKQRSVKQLLISDEKE